MVRVLDFLRVTRAHGVLANYPSMVRISFGHSGLLLRCADLDRFLAFVKDYMHEGALDSLLGEFWTRSVPEGQAFFKDRPQLVYHLNLFQHSGAFSTRDLNASGRCSYPGCYDPLVTTSLTPGEGFDTARCHNFDFSPCEWATPLLRDHPDLHELLQAGKGLLHQLQKVTVPQEMLVLGQEGLSCHEVCSTCAEWLLPAINHCSDLKQVTECATMNNVTASDDSEGACEVDGVIHLPALGASVRGSVCSVSSLSNSITCATKRESTRRLCLCLTPHNPQTRP